MNFHRGETKLSIHLPSPRRSGEKVPKADEGRAPELLHGALRNLFWTDLTG